MGIGAYRVVGWDAGAVSAFVAEERDSTWGFWEHKGTDQDGDGRTVAYITSDCSTVYVCDGCDQLKCVGCGQRMTIYVEFDEDRDNPEELYFICWCVECDD